MAFNIVESDSECVLENNGAEKGQCVRERVGSSGGKGRHGKAMKAILAQHN